MNYKETMTHINKIQSALWENTPGNVSVFIGSGFSKNSDSKVANKSFPDWKTLSTIMIDELYPTIEENKKNKLYNQN